jgi:predicted RNase H-like HicB family nuclease
MRNIIQFRIYRGEEKYVVEGVDLPIVTEGMSLDEAVSNLREALALHLEGENMVELGLGPHPSVLVNFELEPLNV